MTMPPLPPTGDNTWRDDWGQAVHDQADKVMQATTAPTANRLIIRDAAGRAQVVDGSAAADIATKGQVDAAVAGRITAFADPNADRIVFWDDSAGAFVALAPTGALSITGTNLQVAAATETAVGVAEIATAGETATGTDDTRIVTPAKLKTELDKKANLLLTQTVQTGTAYTFVLGDAGTMVEGNNTLPITWTVPPNSAVPFQVGTQILGRQIGAGPITLNQGLGVTINARGNALKLMGQWSEFVLTKRATDVWVLSGDITP